MHVIKNLRLRRIQKVKFNIFCSLLCVLIFCIPVAFISKFHQKDTKSSTWLTESTVLNKTNIRGMICTLLKDEAIYIQEWISFHTLIGVDLFIIYDDNSTDDLTQKLHSFRDKLIVIPWGSIKNGHDNQEHVQSTRQISAARHCAAQYGLIPEWLIFLDVDEFIFPCSANVTDVRPFIHNAAVKLECLKFGTGLEDRPALPNELTIEKHTLRAPYEKIDKNTIQIKRNFSSCSNHPRLCETEGSWKYAYNTRKYPQNQKILAQTLTMHGSPSIAASWKQLTREEGICCNHYGFRSTALALQKAKKNRNKILAMTVMNNESMILFNSIEDKRILRYATLVKKNLSQFGAAFHSSYDSD